MDSFQLIDAFQLADASTDHYWNIGRQLIKTGPAMEDWLLDYWERANQSQQVVIVSHLAIHHIGEKPVDGRLSQLVERALLSKHDKVIAAAVRAAGYLGMDIQATVLSLLERPSVQGWEACMHYLTVDYPSAEKLSHAVLLDCFAFESEETEYYTYYLETAVLIRSLPDGDNMLFELFDQSNPLKRGAILFALSSNGYNSVPFRARDTARVVDLLTSVLVVDENEHVLIDAMLGLLHLGELRLVLPAVFQLYSVHSSLYVKANAMECLVRASLDEYFPLVVQAAKDERAILRRAAADVFGELPLDSAQKQVALECLAALMVDEDEDVRVFAGYSLDTLTD